MQSAKKMKELLDPIEGFNDFLQQRQAQRERELAGRLDVASTEAEKDIYFIDKYLSKNLADARTEKLLKLRERLDASLKAHSIDQLTKANETFQTYINDNALRDQYQTIAHEYVQPPPSPAPQPPRSPAEDLGMTEKSKFAITGPEDDIVLIYNAAPSAPSVAKDILGRFVFLTGTASLCFAQSLPDENHIWFVERLIRDQGATDIKRDLQPCDMARSSASIDIIVFIRGQLRKQRREYIRVLANLLEDDTFREYGIVTANDYAGEIQSRHALSLKFAQEVEKNERAGYGILTVTEASLPACIVTPPRTDHVEGLKELLLRERVRISNKLLPDWQFVEMKVEDAFIAIMKQQCGYVAGDASALRTMMDALRRERKPYEFAPVWFETDNVANLSAELIRKKDQQEIDKKAKKDLADKRNEQMQGQKTAIEAKLRKENGPRAQALRDRIHNLIHDLPKDAAEKAEPRTVDAEHAVESLFPDYSAWLDKRLADQWETIEVTSDVDDFGVVQWNGRPLDGIIVKTMVKQKNRILGEYGAGCFLMGIVDDVEFSMQRDPITLQCNNNERPITNWKVRRQFKSKWNWELDH